MTRVYAVLLRIFLVAAFVPALVGASVRQTPAILAIILTLVAVSWVSLRLEGSRRGRWIGLVLATVACAAVWSLAAAVLGGSTVRPPTFAP